MTDTELLALVLIPLGGTTGLYFLRDRRRLHSYLWGLCIFGALLATLLEGSTIVFSAGSFAGVLLLAFIPACALILAGSFHSVLERPVLMWVVPPVAYLAGLVLALSVTVTSGLLEP